MWVRRVVAAAAVVLVASGVAGCSAAAGGSGTASPAPPPPPATIPADPVAALAAGRALLGTESARFAQDDDFDLRDYSGVADVRTGNWEIRGREYVVRRVGTDVFIQATGKMLESMFVAEATRDRLAAGGWAHTRLPNGREYGVVFNDDFPWNLGNPATRATGVTRTGARSFAGTVPGRKAELQLKADLDDRGRLTSITVASDKPKGRVVYTFAEFGVPVAIVAPPPAEVAEEDNPSFTAALMLS